MAATLAVAVAGCSGSGDGGSRPRTVPPPSPTATSAVTSTTALRKVTVKARLTGRAVVPGPGAQSGSGSATVTLDAADSQVCFDLSVAFIDPAQTADLFTAPLGAVGPSTVALTPPDEDGKSSGCATTPQGIVESIALNPAGFYIQITNVQFPGGALRGQLAY